MKILVLAEHYKKANNYSLLYVHTRNLEYKKHGHDVVVLNFKEKNNYNIDGIEVYGEKKLLDKFNFEDFDIILSHAPNLKNHFRFLIKNFKKINNIIFFIHGHEVLIKDKYYPKPFKYTKKRFFKNIIHYVYDRFKVLILSFLFPFILSKKISGIIFVSQWMKDEFFNCLKVSSPLIETKSKIIHNAANPVFFKKRYSPSREQRDFVTIRPFDGPKYCVDIVYKLALNNPNLTFTLYGKGDFFKHHLPPKNLKIFEKYLEANEICDVLNDHKAALMLTRLDAQGVMACEIASYGAPLITSDIPLKRDLLSSFKNVSFIQNDGSNKLDDILETAQSSSKIYNNFETSHLIEQEINFFKSIQGNKL